LQVSDRTSGLIKAGCTIQNDFLCHQQLIAEKSRRQFVQQGCVLWKMQGNKKKGEMKMMIATT
jgi:hypothetical protein